MTLPPRSAAEARLRLVLVALIGILSALIVLGGGVIAAAYVAL